MTTVWAGGGVRGGQVIGKTDATGGSVADFGWSGNRDIRPEDVTSTIYSALGIDYTTDASRRSAQPRLRVRPVRERRHVQADRRTVLKFGAWGVGSWVWGDKIEIRWFALPLPTPNSPPNLLRHPIPQIRVILRVVDDATNCPSWRTFRDVVDAVLRTGMVGEEARHGAVAALLQAEQLLEHVQHPARVVAGFGHVLQAEVVGFFSSARLKRAIAPPAITCASSCCNPFGFWPRNGADRADLLLGLDLLDDVARDDVTDLVRDNAGQFVALSACAMRPELM